MKRVSARLGIAFVVTAMIATLVPLLNASAAHASTASTGYRLLGGDGGVFPFGAPFVGSAASDPARCPSNVTDRARPDGTCWAVAATPDGNGYWILNGDTGTVYAYGDAPFLGDPAQHFAGVNRSLVPNGLAIASTPSGRGYWVLEAGMNDTGSVFPYGDAGYFGDTTSIQSHTGRQFAGLPVGFAAAPDGRGYWEVDSDGGVFAFGSARFFGSMSGRPLAARVVGMTRTASGNGYWLAAADGGVFAFGDARFAGSMHARPLRSAVVGMTRNAAGPGYWLATADGGVFAFGGAPYLGSLSGMALHRPIFAIVAARAT